MNKYIRVKTSKIHGTGIYAACNIPKETLIIQYVGKKLSKAESEKILEKSADKAHALIYLFTLNDKYDLDGDVAYNIAKYINHSCDPNCESVYIGDEVWIQAKRDIKNGEELSYDYHFPRLGWEEHRCHCATKDCFGFIVSKEYRTSIAKTKRYQRLRVKDK